MSEETALAGGLAGAAIGGYFGYAGVGFTLGSSLGGQVDQPGTPDIKPGDKRFTFSAYGNFQTFGMGTYPVFGEEVWSSNWIVKKKEDEEDGIEFEYFDYFRHVAIYLCDCTSGPEIDGLLRLENAQTGEILWENSASGNIVNFKRNKHFARDVRVYTGSATQEPDPLIVAQEGWSPGFRGHAWVMIDKMRHGQRQEVIPLKAIVARNGALQLAPSLIEDWNLTTGDTPGSVKYKDGIIDSREYAKNGTLTNITHKIHDVDGNLLSTSLTLVANYRNKPNMGSKSVANNSNYMLGVVPASGTTDVSQWFYKGVPGDTGGVTTIWSPTNSFYGTSTLLHASKTIYLMGVTYAISTSRTTTISGWKIRDDGQPERQARFGWDSLAHFYPGDTLNDQPNLVIQTYGVDYDSGDVYALVLNTPFHASGRVIVRLDKKLRFIKQYELDTTGGYNPQGTVFGIWKGYLFSLDFSENYDLYQFDDATDTFSFVRGYASTGTAAYSPRDLGDGLMLTNDGIVTLQDVLSEDGMDLDDVITELAQRADVPPTELSLGGVPAEKCSIRMRSLRPARDWMIEINRVYALRMRNSGGKLDFVQKTAAAVATIPDEDIGLKPVAGNIDPAIEAERVQPIDKPTSVTLHYASKDRNYQEGQQEYVMRNFSAGKPVTINTPVILDDQQALDLANAWCKEPHLQPDIWKTTVGFKWFKIEAGDALNLSVGRVVVSNVEEKSPRHFELTVEADDIASYTGNGLPAPLPQAVLKTGAIVGPTELHLLDIPLLNSDNDTPGFYAAAHGWYDGWIGALVRQSRDDGASYSEITAIDAASYAGKATAKLQDGPVGTWDGFNRPSIYISRGPFPAFTEDDVYEGKGLLAWGEQGRYEILAYQGFTDNGDGTGTFDTLLRGLYGTEHNTANHATGDTVLALDEEAIEKINGTLSDKDIELLYKGISLTKQSQEVDAQPFTNAMELLKPWSPVYARAERDASNTVTFSWNRRSRYLAVALYWTPELAEATEDYELDIYNPAFTTVQRTLTSSTESVGGYTAAQQVADGYTAGDPINFKIYQMSADVGRGNALEAAA